MRGINHGGYYIKADEPYSTREEAEDRIRRIRRDNPEMKADNSLKAGNYTWYYEVVPYRNGWAVLGSYTPVNQWFAQCASSRLEGVPKGMPSFKN